MIKHLKLNLILPNTAFNIHCDFCHEFLRWKQCYINYVISAAVDFCVCFRHVSCLFIVKYSKGQEKNSNKLTETRVFKPVAFLLNLDDVLSIWKKKSDRCFDIVFPWMSSVTKVFMSFYSSIIIIIIICKVYCTVEKITTPSILQSKAIVSRHGMRNFLVHD